MTPEPEEPAAIWCHLQVIGRVQGVGFRLSCQAVARELGVAGWVRNLPEGSVELVALGPAHAVRALAAWCERGPAAAQVDRVVARWGQPGEPPPADLGPFPEPFSVR